MTRNDGTNLMSTGKLKQISPNQMKAKVEENQNQKEIMCWKDPNKLCKCQHPQEGIFCGRIPFPTD